jgi:hypothetical protein
VVVAVEEVAVVEEAAAVEAGMDGDGVVEEEEEEEEEEEVVVVVVVDGDGEVEGVDLTNGDVGDNQNMGKEREEEGRVWEA